MFLKKFLVPSALILSTSSCLAASFSLSSPNLILNEPMHNQLVFNGFGCSGENISPELNWQNIPTGTKSFAMTVYDPDAPTGSGWWHWVVFNLPAETTKLPLNAGSIDKHLMPNGTIQSRTDFGTVGYGGACPPRGDKPHRYQFTVYALKTDKLPLDSMSPAAMVGFYIHQNLIEKATIEVKYGH